MEPTPIEKHPAYWKVKCAFYEVQQADIAHAVAVEKFKKTLKDAGLDPDVVYTLSDDAETITLKP